MIEFSISGVAQVNKMLEKVSDLSRYEEAMKEITITAFTLAKRYAPELTGRMMQQITYGKSGPMEWEIRCDVPYAVYNEYGTVYMAAGTPEVPLPVVSGSGKHAFRPFMRPALIQAKMMAGDIVKEKVLK